MQFDTTRPSDGSGSRGPAAEAARGKGIARGQFIIIVVIAVAGALVPAKAADSGEAKAIFRRRCTACHTFGRGVKVGPDLKGVTERRTREWLIRFVRGSSSVIQSGDPTANKLFREFNRERMPDWSDLSPEQVTGVLDYFAANGPLQKEPEERDATTATAREIEMGRRLFHGRSPLHYGGRACHTCHAIRDREPNDGSLGPDLTGAYFKYRDRALTDYLRRPCFAREPESSAAQYLTPQETFDLKAYMAKAGGLSIPVPPAVSGPVVNRPGEKLRGAQ